jgi:hypothetical protein
VRARPNTHGKYNLREHHQCAGFLVNILVRPLPLFPDPLLTEEQLEVVIGHSGGREGPWSFKTRAIRVASTESVSTGEGDDFLVIESTVLGQAIQGL